MKKISLDDIKIVNKELLTKINGGMADPNLGGIEPDNIFKNRLDFSMVDPGDREVDCENIMKLSELDIKFSMVDPGDQEVDPSARY